LPAHLLHSAAVGRARTTSCHSTSSCGSTITLQPGGQCTLLLLAVVIVSAMLLLVPTGAVGGYTTARHLSRPCCWTSWLHPAAAVSP